MLNTPLPPAPEDAATVLSQALAQLRAQGGGMPRDQVLVSFRRHLARIQQHVRDAFETYRMAGVEAAQRLAALTDGVVRVLYEHAESEITAGRGLTDRVAIAATGGYGRMMLAPFSDIDLLFLAPDEPEPVTLRVIEFMLYFMWDLGLKVGHATRSIAHCLADAEEDRDHPHQPDGCAAACWRRRICSPRIPGRRMTWPPAAEAGPGAFITAKQAERHRTSSPLRRKRVPGGTEHQGRPRRPAGPADAVLDGAGGLRAIHAERAGRRKLAAVCWTFRNCAGCAASWDFLWTVRFHMHYVSGRAEDRLTFDLQPVVGARMGYTRHGRQDGVERFMRHYFLTARDVTRHRRVCWNRR